MTVHIDTEAILKMTKMLNFLLHIFPVRSEQNQLSDLSTSVRYLRPLHLPRIESIMITRVNAHNWILNDFTERKVQ